MKRTGLTRRSALARKTELARAALKRHGGGLRRTAGLRRTGRRFKVDRAAAAHWHKTVLGARDAWDWHAHHIVPQQTLKARARELGIDANLLLWDPRIGMPLLRQRHYDHHYQPGGRLRRAEVQAAAPLGLERYLEQWDLRAAFEREYPT